MEDNYVSDIEYNIIVKEYEKYLELKTPMKKEVDVNFLNEDEAKKELLKKDQRISIKCQQVIVNYYQKERIEVTSVGELPPAYS